MAEITVTDIYKAEYYYAHCSDCGHESESHHFSEAVIKETKEEGWSKVEAGLVCPQCATKYPAEELYD